MPSSVLDEQVEQRIVEAAARLGRQGAVTGWAALRMHGAGFFDGLGRDGSTRLPVALLTGGRFLRDAPGTSVSHAEVGDDEVVVCHGVRTTIVERALLDELGRLRPDLREMVVAVDMAAAARLTSIRRFRTYVLGHPRVRGIDLVSRAIGLANEGSLSPPETRLRLLWELDAELPPPLCNRPVLSLRTGRLLGVPDLLDGDRGPAAEYDGGFHRQPARHRRDNARREEFAAAGLESVTFVGRELSDEALVVRRLRAAYARAPERRQEWIVGDAGPSLDELLDRRDRRSA